MVSKYLNRKITVNGETFDSKKEYARWNELKLLQRTGKISDLQRQVKFVLIPAQHERFPRYSDKTGKRLKDGIRTLEQEVSYIADFVYKQDGKQIVEDTKGFRTPDYKIKKKLLLWVHGIRIKET